MNASLMLLMAGGIAAIVATGLARPIALRLGMTVAGLCGIGAAVAAHMPALLPIPALLAALNAGHLALMLLARQRTRFSPEEQAMIADGLPGLNRAQARHLLDQGLWIDGQAGEILIHEDRPVTHLFYLARGVARVTRNQRPLATIDAPTFVGEVTVLDEAGATATVMLAEPTRFWCVPAAELRLFLRENPAIRPALETSFVGTLAAKLRLANRAIAEPR